jgi:predicted DNA binding CopG/RHH family protein
MKARLSKEEKEVLESFEKGEWIPVSDLPKRKKQLAEYARNTLRKDKRLNIRISERDLLELQRKAVREGLPYQTYVSSIIHKFVNGTLLEVKKMANE